jgi:hypothetical protein
MTPPLPRSFPPSLALISMLAQAGEAGGYSYSRPFIQPLPVWDYWYLLLLPLVLAVAVVYKACKCSKFSEIPRAAVGMVCWIVLAFVGTAVGLHLFVWLTQ